MSSLPDPAMEAVAHLRQLLETHASATKADEMSRYMKRNFPFVGVQKPLRESLTKPLVEELKGLPFEDIRGIVAVCWDQPEREFHYFAIDLLAASHKQWTPDAIELFESMMLRHSWWDSIDAIAPNLAARYFKKWPATRDAVVERWSSSPVFWLNRAAILFQLGMKKDTDFALLQSLILRHRGSKEFFIQKAIGWALRQYGRHNPDGVKAFVLSTELPALSRREALKHLGKD